jgi:hypothetical protein
MCVCEISDYTFGSALVPSADAICIKAQESGAVIQLR